MEIKKNKIFIYTLKTISFICFVIYVISFILYILMHNFFFKDAQKIIDKTNINYDFYINKNKLNQIDINLDDVLKKYNISNYAKLWISNALIFKSDLNKKEDSFKGNIINIEDHDLNLLNTNTFSNDINMDKKFAESNNIKNGDIIYIKESKFNEINGKVNTNFDLKHPLFINTPSIFVKNNKSLDVKPNIIYLKLPNSEKLSKEEKENKIKEIEKDLKSKNQDIFVHVNNHDVALNMKPYLQKAIIMQFLVFFISYAFIKSLYNAYLKKQIEEKNVILNTRLNDKKKVSIIYNLKQILIKIFEGLFLGYLGVSVFDVIAKQYLFNLNIYIAPEKTQIYISVISAFLIIILDTVLNNLIFRKLHNKDKK